MPTQKETKTRPKLDFLELRRNLRDTRRKLEFSERENKQLKEKIRDSIRSQDELWFGEDNVLMFTHECLGMTQTSPLEGWSISRSGLVSPSIHCLRCGAHFMAEVNVSIRHTEFRTWGRPWELSKRLPPPQREELPHDTHWGLEGRHTQGALDLGVERRPRGEGGGEGGVREEDGDGRVPGVGR